MNNSNSPNVELGKKQAMELRDKIQVCIVDDFATICNISKIILGKIGFNPKNISAIYGPKASFDLKKAIENYRTYEPELSWKIPKVLFLDWHMPGLSGLELLKEIRREKDPRISNMVVILVTAEASSERVVEAIQTGVDNYVTKPHNQDILEKKLNAISIKTLRKAEKLAQEPIGDINNIIEMLNLSIALDIKNEKAKKMKQEVLHGAPEQVVKIVGEKIKDGKVSANEGKYGKAVGEFGNALDLKPKNCGALMEYGKMMMKKTLYEDAVKSFESALEAIKDEKETAQTVREVDLLDLLGEAQLKLSLVLEEPDNMEEKAIITLEKASKLFENEKDKKGQAQSLAKIGNVHSARAAESEYRAKRSQDEKEANELMEASQGHANQAISKFEESIKHDFEQSSTLIMLANAYKKTGRKGDAENALKKAQDLKPVDPKSLIEFGKAWLEKGDNQKALPFFNVVKKKISKEDIELYEEIILSLLKHNLPEEAAPFIETVAGERPDLYNNLGVAFRRTKKLKKAIEAYAKAIQYDITGDRVGYLYNQGMAYKADGDLPAAMKNFLIAAKTDKTFENATAQLENSCAELCNKAHQKLQENEIASAKYYFKLASIASPHSEDANNGLNQFNIAPSSLWNETELKQLGFDEPAILLDDFGA